MNSYWLDPNPLHTDCVASSPLSRITTLAVRHHSSEALDWFVQVNLWNSLELSCSKTKNGFLLLQKQPMHISFPSDIEIIHVYVTVTVHLDSYLYPLMKVKSTRCLFLEQAVET